MLKCNQNFFTSLKLGDKQKKAKSLVGTVNRVREVYTSVTEANTDLYTKKFCKHDDTILIAYRCKSNKNVILLSIMIPSVPIGSGEAKTRDS